MIVGTPSFFLNTIMLLAIKLPIKIGVVVGIFFFITMGDQVLPEPLKSASYNTRTGIINFVGRTIFKLRKVDLNEQRQQELDDLENGVGN